MKFWILFMILFLGISNGLLSQREWAPIGASWHYTVPQWPFISYEKISSEKDTIILGQNCKKLISRTGDSEIIREPARFTYMEDQKVYHYIPSLEKFGLLYDFTKEAGDTWTVETSLGDFSITVDSIDFVHINDSSLKIQYVNDNGWGHFRGSIIEGIGHMQYLFPVPGLADPALGPFRCYEDSILGLFQFDSPSQGIIPCDTVWNPLISEEDEMFPIGAEWYYEWRTSFGPYIYYDYLNYRIIKDTVIQNKVCKIRSYVDEGNISNTGDILYEKDGKVYRYFSDIDYFGLIYDFSLNAGESYIGTLGGRTDTMETAVITIDSVKTIEINEIARKVQYFSNDSRWDFEGMAIEGIGNTQIGFFPQHGLDDSGWEMLRCYADSSLGHFQSVSYSCDSTWTMRIDNIAETPSQIVSIYPNPTANQLSISIDARPPNISEITLFDLHGKRIYQQNFKAPKREYILDMNDFPTGIYLLEIKLRSGERVRKKVWKQ